MKKEYGSSNPDFRSVLLKSLKGIDLTIQQRASLIILGAREDAVHRAAQLNRYYESDDPAVCVDSWTASWGSIDGVLSEHFERERSSIVHEIDKTIRAFNPDIDPLSLPLEHPSSPISTFYNTFQKILPKPILSGART